MTEAIGPGTPAARPRLTCEARTILPAQFRAAAIALARECGEEGAVDTDLCCLLEEHTVGAHWGFVTDLLGPESGAVWASWTTGSPTGTVVLPDCEAVAAGTGEFCCEFAAHPGAHSWEMLAALGAAPWAAPEGGSPKPVNRHVPDPSDVR